MTEREYSYFHHRYGQTTSHNTSARSRIPNVQHLVKAFTRVPFRVHLALAQRPRIRDERSGGDDAGIELERTFRCYVVLVCLRMLMSVWNSEML